MWRRMGVSAAAGVLAVACGGGPETGDNVRDALGQANMRSVHVDVDKDSRVVRLQGTVDTLADRTRAEEIAASVVGTTGRVVNALTVEALDDRAPEDADGRLTDALDRLLDEDPVLRERDVNVHVSNGRVTITGEVRTTGEKNRVERLSRTAPGVTDVDNRLEMEP